METLAGLTIGASLALITVSPVLAIMAFGLASYILWNRG